MRSVAQRHEPVVTGERPKIICGQHGNGCQHAEPAGAEPHPAPRITSAEPPSSTAMAAAAQSHAGCRPKCCLLGDRGGKVEQLREAADQIGRHQRNPRQMRRAGAQLRIAAIQLRRIGPSRVISHRPAGAAERAPEALEVGDRQPARPGVRMVVAMDAAGVGAAAASAWPAIRAACAGRPAPPRRRSRRSFAPATSPASPAAARPRRARAKSPAP